MQGIFYSATLGRDILFDSLSWTVTLQHYTGLGRGVQYLISMHLTAQ